MIVNVGEALTEDFDNHAYPIGTPLRFSDLTVTDSTGEFRTMQDGVLAGYDEFGGRSHVLVERVDEAGVPLVDGTPKIICTAGLDKFVELIEIDQDADKMPPGTLVL